MITQNDTSPIDFFMADSADPTGDTPKTGLTPTVTLSKNGGAFGAAAGTVAEISNGWYRLTPTSGDTGTLGDLAMMASATGAFTWRDRDRVVLAAYAAIGLASANLDSQLSAIEAHAAAVDSRLPAAPADESLIIAATTAIQNAIAALHNLDAAGVRTAVGLAAANLDAQLDAIPTGPENAAAYLDLANAIETGLTPRGALRLLLAAMVGNAAGLDTGNITFKNAVANSKTRITATGDADGNRIVNATDVT